MKTRLHAIAGCLGFLIILTFWTSTVLSELFGSHDTIVLVKGWVLRGMVLLIPAMAITGASGAGLGAGRIDAGVRAKKIRMPIIAANGLLILVPMAFLLEARASAGQFDTVFYLLQAVELAAGATNLTLMGLSIRDGLRLTGRSRPKAQATLLRKTPLGPDMMAFHLSKPEDFTFHPGQAIRLTLPAPAVSDGKGASRILSLVSAPHEPELVVATQLRDSAFKQSLRAMAPGDPVQITGPMGRFGLNPDAARPAVFLAGGIGITPFLSMIRAAVAEGSQQAITLFYSVRTIDDAAFLPELQQIAQTHPGFRLVVTLTGDDAPSGWAGETGRIDLAMLNRHLPSLTDPDFYCVGPTAMTQAAREMLLAAGVSAQRVKIEAFAGY